LVHRGVGPQPAGGATAPVTDPPRPRGLERLGRFSARRKWWVLGTWLLIAVALVVSAAPASKPFRDVFTIPGSDSQAAIDVLNQRFPAENLPTAQVVFHDSTLDVSTYAERNGARVIAERDGDSSAASRMTRRAQESPLDDSARTA